MPSSKTIWKDLERRMIDLREYEVDVLLSQPDVEYRLKAPVIPAEMDRGIMSYDMYSLANAYKPRKSELDNEDRELFNDAWRDQEFVTTFYG